MPKMASIMSLSVSNDDTHNSSNNNKAAEKLYCICKQPYDESNPEFMIECNGCSEWFHGVCVDMDEVSACKFETWHCPECELYHGPSQLKLGLRKRKRKVNYGGLNEAPPDGSCDTDLVNVDYAIRLKSRHKSNAFCKSTACLVFLKGNEFTSDYVDKHGFRKLVLVKDREGLGLVLPEKDFSFAQIARLAGQYRRLKVMDVSTQLETDCSLKEWVEYMSISPKKRDRILNVISFEFSDTKLFSPLVQPPQFVRQHDFVRLHWPSTKNEDRPRVGKYCLMSSQGSYTDFHVDFGGTSVWYHVFKGEKVFYFIEPTRTNLKIYADWAVSGDKQSQQFLGDLVDKCYSVKIKKGQTLFIPSGWIHAVFTPKDSLVFGGNFVHEHLLEMQLQIYSLEKRMRVKQECRFPNYETLMWHVAEHVNEQNVVSIQKRPQHVLSGYKALGSLLTKWAKSPLREHRQQFPPGVNVNKVAESFECTMAKCNLEPLKKELSPKKKVVVNKSQTKVNTPKEAGSRNGGEATIETKGDTYTSVTDTTDKKDDGGEEQIYWVQCDKCNEWRQVPEKLMGGAESESFCCRDLNETCVTQATLWAQCDRCSEWHIVTRAITHPFLCLEVGKECAEQ